MKTFARIDCRMLKVNSNTFKEVTQWIDSSINVLWMEPESDVLLLKLIKHNIITWPSAQIAYQYSISTSFGKLYLYINSFGGVYLFIPEGKDK